ncbi:GNAT family N-acetyltransferase [Nocardia sp. NPDC057663]|uniref:GNAT family N-acetyltransferase n=1 Tax=Nocardia sp. NPDC057663 TaxID=3346201 RepID=UPI00366DA724
MIKFSCFIRQCRVSTCGGFDLTFDLHSRRGFDDQIRLIYPLAPPMPTSPCRCSSWAQPDYRRGIASALLTHIKDWAAESGCARIYLTS